VYELLIIACLAGQPATCDAFQVQFGRPTGMRACIYEAQFRLIAWRETMPGWEIKRWTCGLPKT
jgi:hypothetical protein